MYGYPRLSSVDLVRAAIIKKMVGDGSAITHSSTSLIYQHQQNMDGRSIKESWSLFGLRDLLCRWDLIVDLLDIHDTPDEEQDSYVDEPEFESSFSSDEDD